jgi:hypothetical protein
MTHHCVVGVEVFDVDLTASMEHAFNKDGFDFVLVPLVHPR